MLYKFKSKAAGDLIMLEPHGRRVLDAIGKDGAKGVILPEQIGPAIAALQAAIAREEAATKPAAQDAVAADQGQAAADGVSLRQRATPFIDMLRRSEAEKVEVVWGV
jgi:hypothetical protein